MIKIVYFHFIFSFIFPMKKLKHSSQLYLFVFPLFKKRNCFIYKYIIVVRVSIPFFFCMSDTEDAKCT